MDVIELGRPQPSTVPRRPRRGWPLGVVAIVVLGAVGYGSTRPGKPAPEAQPSPAPVVSTAPVSRPAPEPPPQTPTPEATPPPDPNAGTWTLPRLREHTGLAFASAAHTFTVMDLDSGRVTLRYVPSGGDDYIEPVGPIDDGWLVAHRFACGDFPCEPAEFYTVRGDEVSLVGRGQDATLDPDRRTVWVTGLPPDPTDIETPMWLEHRTLDGARIGKRTTLRKDEGVIGVTPRGPLVGTFMADRAYLLDRSTYARREVVTGRVAVAVAGNEVATMTPGCTGEPGTCRLAVQNVSTGRVRQVAVVHDRPHQLALHPDGRYLAVSFDAGRDSVRVYDVNAARLVPIKGLTFPPIAAGMTWSPDGRWLVMTHAKTADAREESSGATGVAVWRPGFGTAYSAPEYRGIWAGRAVVGS